MSVEPAQGTVYLLTKSGPGSKILCWQSFATKEEAHSLAVDLGYRPREFIVVPIVPYASTPDAQARARFKAAGEGRYK
jgi:hypothetical protein